MTFAPQAKPPGYYKKPSPETMRKNRETYARAYKDEIKWFKDNLKTLIQLNDKFMIEMYSILVTGSRKITPKMESAIKNGVQKCMNNPNYNVLMKTEADEKIRPILSKINIVLIQAESKGHRGIGFIESIKDYVLKNYRITQKQMTALNKIYKELNG